MNHTRKRTHGAACLPLLLGVALALLLGPTSAYAGSNYQQVTGGADGTNPKAVASQFEFTSGISADYDKTKVVWEDTSGTSDANASVGKQVNGDSTVPFQKGQPVTLVIPDGFTYLDGQKYDIHVRVIPNSTETDLDWRCDFGYRSDTCYMTLTPYYHAQNWTSSYDYDYEIWLTNGSTDNATAPQDIKIVGGSCYMAEKERCRPYSDDGLIYTKVAKEDLTWSTAYNAWTVQNKQVNDKADHYVLGHGTQTIDGNAVLKGAYARVKTAGQSELVLGYLNYEISVDKQTTSTPSDPAGYVTGEIIKYTVSVANAGTDTLTDVELTDDLADIKLTGVSYSTGSEHSLTQTASNTWAIDRLVGGEVATFSFEHVVTDADVASSKVVNGAKAVGHYIDGQAQKSIESADSVSDPTTTKPDTPTSPTSPSTPDIPASPTTPVSPTAPTEPGNDTTAVTPDTQKSAKRTVTVLPKTGDATNVAGIAVLGAMGALALCISARRRMDD